MAHAAQLHFVGVLARHLAESWAGKRVLEIGSYDVNGSIRPFFENADYTGVDLTEGPGVDVVCDAEKLDFPDASFDLTISCECFEHNPNWVQTFTNMWRMTKPGGAVAMTCASLGRPEHGTTRRGKNQSPGTQSVGWDYYRNVRQRDFEHSFDLAYMFTRWSFQYNPAAQDLYFAGIKRGGSGFELSHGYLQRHGILESPNTAAQRFWLRLGLVVITPMPDRLYQDIRYYSERARRAPGKARRLLGEVLRARSRRR